jgi:polar amino acid transport system substrate-binding protein
MSRSHWSRVLAVLAVLALALVAAGCGGGSDDNEGGGGDEGETKETLTVGSDVPYPPFEEGKAPNFTGFDIELLEAVAENTGREAEFQDTSFDTIFRDLAQGKFEAVASATTITDEREETVDFTNPYYRSEQAILVKDGETIDSVESLKGATVGVQQGTTGQEFTEEKAEADEVRPYPQGPDAVAALQSGTVDAVVIDIPVAEKAVEAESGIEISAAIPTEEEYGFVVAQGETELLKELNEGLEQAKEDGTYTKIYEKWFKHEPPEEIFSATHKAS